jgi:hypothetical protein
MSMGAASGGGGTRQISVDYRPTFRAAAAVSSTGTFSISERRLGRASLGWLAVSRRLKTPVATLTYGRDYEKVLRVRARKHNSEPRQIQRLIEAEAHMACTNRSETT